MATEETNTLTFAFALSIKDPFAVGSRMKVLESSLLHISFLKCSNVCFASRK